MVTLKMLSTKEAAERLGAGESSIKLWCGQGRFPNAQKVGTVWIIPESDLDAFEWGQRGRPPKKKSPVKGKSK